MFLVTVTLLHEKDKFAENLLAIKKMVERGGGGMAEGKAGSSFLSDIYLVREILSIKSGKIENSRLWQP